MRIAVERSLAIAFAMAAVALGFACIVAQLNTLKLSKADAWVNHTLSVMEELQATMNALRDLETANRTYLTDGKSTSLKSIVATKTAAGTQIERVASLTRDNPVQEESIKILRALRDQQMTYQDKLIQLAETEGLGAAQKESMTNPNRQTGNIRRLLNNMHLEEMRLLSLRQRDTQKRQKVVSWVISALSVLVITFLLITYLMLRNYLKQRNKAETMLRQNRASLLKAEQIARMGNWALHPGGRVTWSPTLYEIYRRDPELPPPTYEDHQKYFTPEVWERLAAAVKAALEQGIPYDEELELVHKDGDRSFLKASGRIDKNDKGEIIGLHGTVQDITDSRLAFEREQSLTHKAQAAEQAKAHFLAVMSHEIRTPMNGVLGFADLLAQHPLPVEQLEYVHTIQESGRALLRIINDVLDYSRMESGKLEVELAPFSPSHLLENVRVLLTSTTRFRPVEFKTDIHANLPKLLVGDAGRLRQIIINLAGNSLKFTEHGCVTLGVRPGGERKDDIRTWLEFYVQDTGIGISQEKVEQIFQPFVQADNSIARRYGGVGLGLSISEYLVKLMGGEISVESTPDQGTTFTFDIPLEIAPEGSVVAEFSVEQPYDETFATHHPLNILVAEDDLINSKLIIRMLTRLGYKPRHVRTGGEAVETFRDERPNFIFMDIHMPGMDGLKATREIRRIEEESHTLERVYIAACTADVMPKERRQCFDYGMDDYLTKPLQQSALVDALRRATAV
ncbi:MAG: ATP-binding protein [Chthoniobacterales bacterium]